MSVSSSVPTATAFVVMSPNSPKLEALVRIMIQLDRLISSITCSPDTTSISLPDSLYENFMEMTHTFKQAINMCLKGDSIGQHLKYIEHKLDNATLIIKEYVVSKDTIKAAEINFKNSKNTLKIEHYSQCKNFSHIHKAVLTTKEGLEFSMSDICISPRNVYIKSMESSSINLTVIFSNIIFSEGSNPTIEHREIIPKSESLMSIEDQQKAIFLLLNSLKLNTFSTTLENIKVAPLLHRFFSHTYSVFTNNNLKRLSDQSEILISILLKKFKVIFLQTPENESVSEQQLDSFLKEYVANNSLRHLIHEFSLISIRLDWLLFASLNTEQRLRLFQKIDKLKLNLDEKFKLFNIFRYDPNEIPNLNVVLDKFKYFKSNPYFPHSENISYQKQFLSLLSTRFPLMEILNKDQLPHKISFDLFLSTLFPTSKINPITGKPDNILEVDVYFSPVLIKKCVKNLFDFMKNKIKEILSLDCDCHTLWEDFKKEFSDYHSQSSNYDKIYFIDSVSLFFESKLLMTLKEASILNNFIRTILNSQQYILFKDFLIHISQKSSDSIETYPLCLSYESEKMSLLVNLYIDTHSPIIFEQIQKYVTQIEWKDPEMLFLHLTFNQAQKLLALNPNLIHPEKLLTLFPNNIFYIEPMFKYLEENLQSDDNLKKNINSSITIFFKLLSLIKDNKTKGKQSITCYDTCIKNLVEKNSKKDDDAIKELLENWRPFLSDNYKSFKHLFKFLPSNQSIQKIKDVIKRKGAQEKYKASLLLYTCLQRLEYRKQYLCIKNSLGQLQLRIQSSVVRKEYISKLNSVATIQSQIKRKLDIQERKKEKDAIAQLEGYLLRQRVIQEQLDIDLNTLVCNPSQLYSVKIDFFYKDRIKKFIEALNSSESLKDLKNYLCIKLQEQYYIFLHGSFISEEKYNDIDILIINEEKFDQYSCKIGTNWKNTILLKLTLCGEEIMFHPYCTSENVRHYISEKKIKTTEDIPQQLKINSQDTPIQILRRAQILIEKTKDNTLKKKIISQLKEIMEKDILEETLFQGYKNSYTGKTHLYNGVKIDVVLPAETSLKVDRFHISDILITLEKNK